MGEFDWDAFIENLWERENAHGKKGVEGKGGYRNGKYYPYKTPNGNTDIGPGFDIDHQSAEFKERAKKGFTKKELDSIVKDRLKDEIHYFNQKIATEGGDTTNIPDNIYAGLLDMQWQVGNGLYSNFPNLWKAVAKRDYDGMRRESEVTYLDSKGNRHVDTGRRDFRNSTYFNGPSRTTIKPIFPSYAEQPDAIKPLNPYSAPIESRKTGYGPYKDKYSFTESEDRKAKIKKAVEARQLYNKVMDATSLQNTALPQFKSPFAEGGFLQSKDAWDKLSMYEKAAMMKVAVQNGITNLQDIRQKYNEFAEGGNKEDEYYSQMEKVAEENYKDWGYSNPDEALVHALNDNTYNYRGYYENNPSSSANASTHWPDAYKTVYHPTFSNESIYSGTVSQYNPLGLPGGFWVGDTFIPRAWQVDASMNKYKNGGGIHIKPSHRGRLTELKKRTGKSEAELYNDGNPAHKRMVVFARNARKWKHGLGGPLVESAMNEYMHGGPMGNYYDGFGDAWNLLKKGVQKARQKVRDWGLDKSPAAHLSSRLEKASKDIQENKNPEFGTGTTALLNTGRILGLNSYTKGSDNNTHYRQNLYNLVDPTNVIPESMGDYLDYANIVRHAKSDKDYKYRRVKKDSTADAAWAKRLELPYDSTLLISNPDGSVHLSEQLENEIPTDTTFIKQRIADNNKLLKTTYGPKRRDIEVALSIDSVALDNLRHTYRTGEPVEMNEFSHNSRNLRTNNETSPLNLLHRYTLQYNPSNNTMGYRDTYNFDGLEDFVPGEPFEIRGTIDLNKKKR